MNKELKKALLKFEVPQADENKIDELISLVGSRNTDGGKREQFSLLRQLSIQITYFDKGFYIMCFVFLLYISVLALNDMGLYGVFLRTPPLLMIPCGFMLLRSRYNKMYELERSSRYGYTRLFVGKILIAGLVSVIAITMSWVCAAFILPDISIKSLLLAACSYAMSCLLLLWLGRKNIIRGLGACIVWCGFLQVFSRYAPAEALVERIQLGMLVIVFAIIGCLIVITCNHYLKYHRFQEDEIWNLA